MVGEVAAASCVDGDVVNYFPYNLDRFADIVSVIGSAAFNDSFNRLLTEMLEVDHCTVFSFASNDEPRILIADGASVEAQCVTRQLAKDYVAGWFRSDPAVRAWPDNGSIMICNADEIEPDHRRHFYDVASLAGKLVLCATSGSTRYFFSFYRRRGQPPFSRVEVDKMNHLSQFLLRSMHRHAELVAPLPRGGFEIVSVPDDRGPGLHAPTVDYLRGVIAQSAAGLSPREAEVCAAVVLGYSTVAISLNCGISHHTVATHRKRAYAKLGISSQNELFSQYFSIVCDFQAKQTREAAH